VSELGHLLDALDKLPPAGGLSWRGLDGPPSSVPELGVLTAVVPTSRDPRVATENFTARTILVLLNRTGRDLSALSAHPQEAEVVQRPGSVWRRLPDRAVGAPAPLVVLEEVDPAGYTPPTDWPATLDELDDRLRLLLGSARQQGPVGVTRPGTFTGPWPVTVAQAGPAGS
jgi:hypothetical protein